MAEGEQLKRKEKLLGKGSGRGRILEGLKQSIFR